MRAMTDSWSKGKLRIKAKTRVQSVWLLINDSILKNSLQTIYSTSLNSPLVEHNIKSSNLYIKLFWIWKYVALPVYKNYNF